MRRHRSKLQTTKLWNFLDANEPSSMHTGRLPKLELLTEYSFVSEAETKPYRSICLREMSFTSATPTGKWPGSWHRIYLGKRSGFTERENGIVTSLGIGYWKDSISLILSRWMNLVSPRLFLGFVRFPEE